jgi:hypothetical protein
MEPYFFFHMALKPPQVELASLLKMLSICISTSMSELPNGQISRARTTVKFQEQGYEMSLQTIGT